MGAAVSRRPGRTAHLAPLVFAAALAGWAGSAPAQDADKAARAMVVRYVGTYDKEALLREPGVRAELQALAGARLRSLELALNVGGSIDFIDSHLAVSGNAPRRGGELEAVVCISPYGSPRRVHAALLEGREVTVFTREPRWDTLSTCVRDWAALARLGREARIRLPPAVRLATPR